jgi:hypothetical protein
MNAPLNADLMKNHHIAESIAQACDRIAPTWPLDQFIAVNPYWGWVRQPAAQASAQLSALSGTRLTMPRIWFRGQWESGQFRRDHVMHALERCGSALGIDAVIAAMYTNEPAHTPLPLLTQVRDSAYDTHAPLGWTESVAHQISQHCAAYFDDGQARWHLARGDGLYPTWRTQIAADRGIDWAHGRAWLLEQLRTMPADPLALINAALPALGIAQDGYAPYLTANLLSINGWAAWCAYERWHARLSGGDDNHIVHLLAIRLAWEWLLKEDAAPVPAGAQSVENWAANWAAQWSRASERVAHIAAAQQADWVLQTALEIAYQETLAQGLVATSPRATATPTAQAVFCIDVRSEVFRRALEAANPAVHTRGFAGFFGLPIAYTPAGSAMTRPQLPGLLAAAMTVSETTGAEESRPLARAITTRRQQALQWRKQWTDLRGFAASGFSFVESCGLLYGAKLLADSLPSTTPPARWEDTGLPARAQGQIPRLPQAANDPSAAAGLAKGILHAMGLTRDFAPLVLLAGHGSQTANNPHAAGLDCGACGGQTGEVNARALADLLNTAAVRNALRTEGIDIPAGTHFVPGLHNTTTDEVVLYDTQAVPEALQGALSTLRAALAQAGERARAERAAALGLQPLAARPQLLTTSIRQRANDWAQVRPEWGLAGCAAFVVAPRARTQHLNLAGRSFLHDYDWRQDQNLAVLELIMTAPMVVTNWINMQYYASTVDNRRYGSGNKVLHNVVGGRLGVFEGNGGDLRIGLPLQSLHDGQVLRHTPLRLNVYIDAPRAGIDTIIAKHAVVRDLVDNGWLHLFRIDPDLPRVEQYRQSAWHIVREEQVLQAA